jgi:hypothetical protein
MNITFERKKNTLYNSSLNAILHYNDLNFLIYFCFFVFLTMQCYWLHVFIEVCDIFMNDKDVGWNVDK